MLLIVELLCGIWGNGKENNDRASVISHTIRCKNRGYKDIN
jgi:hypothetical protein